MPHIHTEPGQYDHCVDVFIVCNAQVLIRKHDKYNLWLGVGGHIELDEDPNQAALREVKEEVGLDVELLAPRPLPAGDGRHKELIPPFYINSHTISDSHSHVAYVFFAKATSQEVVPENPTDEWHWLSYDDVTTNSLGLEATTQFYALEALKYQNTNYSS